MKNNIIKKIEEIIGKKNVLLSSEDKSKYLIEWRNRYPGKAQAILRPKSTKEVSLLLKLFNKSYMGDNLLVKNSPSNFSNLSKSIFPRLKIDFIFEAKKKSG